MKPKIALFQHNPEAARDCCYGMIKALSPRYDITIFNEKECRTATFKKYDIIAFPGGTGDATKSYDKFFRRKAANAVADFVEHGGKYLGICMGAYWAGRHYFDILKNLDTTQYIRRPQSGIKRSYATVADVVWAGKRYDMYFYDGCTYKGNGRYRTIAHYSNGDPMAIIQNRVGLIGCHPESIQSWYEKKPYMKGYWHHCLHHDLLLDFVDQLLGS
jgi:glutamine amidotransferase-like uncharacterized protein